MSGAVTPLERFAAQGELYEPEREYSERVYWIWLAELLGPACPNAGAVLAAYGSARAVYDARLQPDRFAQAAGMAAAQRMAEEAVLPQECEKILEECNRTGVLVVTYADEEYPQQLRQLPDPPLVLYCTGQLQWLNAGGTVGMVGSRQPSAYGVEAAAFLGDGLAKGGAVIVSGLADGLDSEGHKAAVANNAPTVAVMGVPIDRTYPAANRALRHKIEQNGVVISEYAPGQGIGPNGFLQRNRIIAALSRVLVVVEARKRSGTMSTVEHARRYGRAVYAVPGSIFSTLSEGTNELLCTGAAKPVTEPQPLLEVLGLAQPAPQRTPRKKAADSRLTGPAAAVLAQMGAKPVGLSALVQQTGLPMGQLLSALTELELAGWITALPGRQYLLK